MTGPELPEPADAEAGAARHLQRAVAALLAREAAPADRGSAVLREVVGVLRSAGGEGVANEVLRHLERAGTPELAPEPARPAARERVLTLARELSAAAAEATAVDVRAAGLPPDGARAAPSRAERAEYVGRVLAARRAAVEALLDRLAQG